jgi:hypothetical protein
MARFQIMVQQQADGSEAIYEYEASSIGEALTMAERDNAGVTDVILGIRPEDYEAARVEGIEFNEADGLLL